MTNLTTQHSWGKIIGGILGACVGGPWGAAAGVIIGHMHDQGTEMVNNWSGLWSGYNDFAGNVEQAAFTMGVIVLSAKMAKADGRVTRAEIEAFKRVFNISPQQENAIGLLFDRARMSAEGFEPYAFQLANVYRRNPVVLEEILGGLFIIAASDAPLSQTEITFLKRVAYIFGFDSDAFARVAARAGVELPSAARPRNASPSAFSILGVSESTPADEIKAAYRALIREHHPDRLMAQGMPPEFVANATEKMKRINVAYDTVCKIKGIK